MSHDGDGVDVAKVAIAQANVDASLAESFGNPFGNRASKLPFSIQCELPFYGTNKRILVSYL